MIHRKDIKILYWILWKTLYQILTLTCVTDIRILVNITLCSWWLTRLGLSPVSNHEDERLLPHIIYFTMSICLINISIAGSNTIKSLGLQLFGDWEEEEGKPQKHTHLQVCIASCISLINLTSSRPNYAVEYFICKFLRMLRTHNGKIRGTSSMVDFIRFCEVTEKIVRDNVNNAIFIKRRSLKWFIFHSKKHWSKIYKAFFVAV